MLVPSDESFLPHVKETITIIRPMPSVMPRGVNTKREQDPTRSLRIRQEQLDAIDEAAGLLGVTRSVFMAWCAYHAALDIIRQHREFSKRKRA